MTTKQTKRPDQAGWYALYALLGLAFVACLTGCGNQDRRDRFVAQAAADIDAHVSAIEQGGDPGVGLANIRTLAHAQAQAVGFQIDPAARPVYVPAQEQQP